MGDVTSDVIVGEGRSTGLWIANFAVGNEPGFDECLEAVADAEDETVAVLEEVHDRIGNARAAQDGGDEFPGTGGFVSGGEATGKHEDLGALDVVGE